ncbi:ABC transporter ATP-binding protein [Pantoea sp. App145]|uniref:ABC transporter ATP-binding protein n=1 Tax=Pantoea sp. App145 TaxID=3071567 RepID=UPI003A80782C
MSSIKPVLDVRSLHTELLVGEKWKTIVHPLSFSILPGETLALVGESGSGKSVTANSLLQLLPQSQCRISGEVHFQDRDLLRFTSRQMQAIRGNRIGMIFQEPMSSLNPVLTIGTQITEVLRKHRHMDSASARAEAVRLLDRVQISAAAERLSDYPLHFSGGMRQRVVIAIALACKPALLIADEPTTALDVTVQAEILQLIKSLQREENMAVLFITHDMGVVAEVADKTLVMYQGQEVEMASTRELFRQPKHAYTKRLLAAVPKLGDMAGIPYPQPFHSVTRIEGNTVQSGAPVLEVKNLCQQFPIRQGWLRRIKAQVHAVEQVSFQLLPGETLGLVGESGCGKSTLARTLIRLAEASAGQVILENENLLTANRRQLEVMRRKIQLIFQDPWESLNPRLRVGDALAEPMLAHGLIEQSESRRAVAELLESVGLEASMAERFPHQFSGGQRQRICIARALAVQPKVIIADESVSALDVTVRAEIINLLMALQRERGISILFISHDMAVVERISHRVAVMYQGKIVEIGSRQAIFETPAHPYTRHLLSAVPIADPEQVIKPLVPFRKTGTQRRGINDSASAVIYQQQGLDHYVLSDAGV